MGEFDTHAFKAKAEHALSMSSASRRPPRCAQAAPTCRRRRRGTSTENAGAGEQLNTQLKASAAALEAWLPRAAQESL